MALTKIGLSLVLLTFVASAGGAPLPPEQETEKCAIAVSALGDQGHFLAGLVSTNFCGEWRGEPVKIISVQLQKAPQCMAILVDASASMTDQWEASWAAAEGLVGAASPDTEIHLFTTDAITFAGNPYLLKGEL